MRNSYYNNLNTQKHNVNYITRYFLFIENIKQKSFCYLEDFKSVILQNNKYWNEIKYLKIDEFLNNKLSKSEIINKRKRNNKEFYNLWNKVIIKKWIILNSIKEKSKYQWIYNWKIEWTIVDNNTFKKNNNDNQILILDNLNTNIYPKLKYLKWIIIRTWTKLSHNSIIIREYKIPSIINYNKFNNLKLWRHINIKE